MLRTYRRGQIGAPEVALISVMLSTLPILKDAKQLATEYIAPNVQHLSFRLEEPEPLLLHVIRCPRPPATGISIAPILAGIDSVGLNPVHRIAERLEGITGIQPAAVINGGFFVAGTGAYRMAPVGAFIQAGELIGLPDGRSALVCWANDTIDIERLNGRGELVLNGGLRMPIMRLNQGVVGNAIVMFTPRFGASTLCPTSTDFVQVVASVNALPIRPNATFTARVQEVASGGDVQIPRNGIVLVGHGTAVNALRRLQIGDAFQFRFDVQPAPTPIKWAVGGAPRLVRNGIPRPEWQEERCGRAFTFTRHARTAVGLNEKEIIFVTVEGDPHRGGVGVTLPQLAQLMVELGCTDALNLDGGSSTSLCVRNDVITPTAELPRPVADAIVLWNTAPRGNAVRLVINPNAIHALPGARIPLKVLAEDEAYHRVNVDDDIEWQLTPPVGYVQLHDRPTLVITRKLAQPTLTPLHAILRAMHRKDGLTGEADIFIYNRPQVLSVIPPRLILEPNEEANLRVIAETADGFPLHYPTDALRISIENAPVELDLANLVVRSGNRKGRGTLLIQLSDASARIPTYVGRQWITLDEFDSMERLRVRRLPESVQAQAVIVTRPTYSGDKALQFTFDLSAGETARAAYLWFDCNLGLPLAISCAVYGDGCGAWLRVQLRDARRRIYRLTLARAIRWRDEWRVVEARIPSKAIPPVRLDAIYVVTTTPQPLRGSIVLDKLRIQYPWGETPAP